MNHVSIHVSNLSSVFVEHLEHYIKKEDCPGLDVFICIADPYKEPPIVVVNTALSVMDYDYLTEKLLMYDYPTEKLKVYISDDGGSKLTIFAFIEAAGFAAHWLPYCRNNKVLERCPKAHFGSSKTSRFPETDQLQVNLKT